jgi:drug/metabolite transporter (DMT)-like permease
VYAKLVAVACIWGGTFIAGRIAATAMPAEAAAAGRFAVAAAGLLMAAVLLEGGLPRLTPRQAVGTLAMGLTGIYLYNVGFFYALGHVPAGRTSLFVSLNPVMTLIGGYVFLNERLSRIQVCGIALALVGVAIVITRGDPATALAGEAVGIGEAAMLGAVAAWAAYTLFGRVAMRGLSPIAATTYAALWGLAALTLHAALTWTPLPPTAVDAGPLAAVVYLGLIGTVVAFVWYGEGVRRVGAARAAVFTNLVPVFAVVQAAAILGEPILASMLVGGAVAVAGVTLANRTPAARPLTADPPTPVRDPPP